MRKREEVEEEDKEDEVKNEENEPGHEMEQEQHRSILQGEANPEEDFVAESFFY